MFIQTSQKTSRKSVSREQDGDLSFLFEVMSTHVAPRHMISMNTYPKFTTYTKINKTRMDIIPPFRGSSPLKTYSRQRLVGFRASGGSVNTKAIPANEDKQIGVNVLGIVGHNRRPVNRFERDGTLTKSGAIQRTVLWAYKLLRRPCDTSISRDQKLMSTFASGFRFQGGHVS